MWAWCLCSGEGVVGGEGWGESAGEAIRLTISELQSADE